MGNGGSTGGGGGAQTGGGYQGGWGGTMNNSYSGGNLGGLGTAGVMSGGAGGSGMMGYGGGGLAGVAGSGWGGPGGSAGFNPAGFMGNPGASSEAAARGYTGPGGALAFSQGLSPGNYGIGPSGYLHGESTMGAPIRLGAAPTPTTFHTSIPTQTQALPVVGVRPPTPYRMTPVVNPQYPPGIFAPGLNNFFPNSLGTYPQAPGDPRQFQNMPASGFGLPGYQSRMTPGYTGVGINPPSTLRGMGGVNLNIPGGPGYMGPGTPNFGSGQMGNTTTSGLGSGHYP